MLKLLIPPLFILCSQAALASITPKVTTPDDFNKDRFVTYEKTNEAE